MKHMIWLSLSLLLITSCINEVPISEGGESDMQMSLMTCALNSDCPAGSYCDECTGSSCPNCDDCIPGCLPICESEAVAECEIERPTCTEGEVSIIREGCWLCVDQNTCEPRIAETEPNCSSDQDCAVGQYCNQCATASCPVCEDCVGLCQDSPCQSEEVAECDRVRPRCDEGLVSVIREGCWQCVDQIACEPSLIPQGMCMTNDECEVGSYCDECATSSCQGCADCVGLCTVSSCESEAQAVCEEEPPSCEPGTVLIIRDGCWLCVGRDSCEAMSMAPPLNRCDRSADCSFGSICDPCAGSSCPNCDDCISACRPVCESADSALCNTVQPECEADQVLIVRDGCWLCVDQISCEP